MLMTSVDEQPGSRRHVSIQPPTSQERGDFIREIVAADLRDGRVSAVVTRFPPEPNGHLHIGHAKAICLNFGIASEFGGHCNLRFDDTNPEKEEQAYIDAIEADVRWLGFDWGDHLHHASDYFGQLYDWAVHLIRNGDAYVDDLSADEIREHRGTLTEPGPVRADASGRLSQRRAGAARPDRHGRAEHQPAGSGALPHRARHAPADR
jgi:glutamyl/glutaminyl-tRNA synthetase